MAYSDEIKDYAKTLYLTVSKDGQHKYKEDDIVEKISTKFPELPKFPDRRTINYWISTKDKVTEKSWKDLWKQGVRHGIQNAAREYEKELEGEEELEIEIDKITNLRAGNAIKLQSKISNKLDKNEDLTKEDIAAWRTSEFTFNNLNLESKNTEDSINCFDKDHQKQILEEEGYDES